MLCPPFPPPLKVHTKSILINLSTSTQHFNSCWSVIFISSLWPSDKSRNGTPVVCKPHSYLKKETSLKRSHELSKRECWMLSVSPAAALFLEKEFQVVQWRLSEQAAMRSFHCYSTALCKSIKSRKQPNLSVLKYLEVFLPHLSWLFYRKLEMTVPCWKKKKKAYKFFPGVFQKANPNIRFKKLCSTVFMFWNVNWVIEII